MRIKIWSSLPQNIIIQEFEQAGILEGEYEFLHRIEEISKAEVIFGSIPKEKKIIEQLNNSDVKWIQLDSVDYSTVVELKNIIITNMRGIFSRYIAESILGCLLAFYRGIFLSWSAQQKREWNRWKIRGISDSLTHKNILILGGGSIAEEIIKLLHPFQCTVVVYRRKNISIGEASIINNRDLLNLYLQKSEIVINTLPASNETENFLSKEMLNMLSPEAVIVNVGRGLTIDEDALVDLLINKKIKGAILDVTRDEPLPDDSLLWEIPNLYLMQHTSAGHKEELRLKCRVFSENFKYYSEKKRLINEIKL